MLLLMARFCQKQHLLQQNVSTTNNNMESSVARLGDTKNRRNSAEVHELQSKIVFLWHARLLVDRHTTLQRPGASRYLSIGSRMRWTWRSRRCTGRYLEESRVKSSYFLLVLTQGKIFRLTWRSDYEGKRQTKIFPLLHTLRTTIMYSGICLNLSTRYIWVESSIQSQSTRWQMAYIRTDQQREMKSRRWSLHDQSLESFERRN